MGQPEYGIILKLFFGTIFARGEHLYTPGQGCKTGVLFIKGRYGLEKAKAAGTVQTQKTTPLSGDGSKFSFSILKIRVFIGKIYQSLLWNLCDLDNFDTIKMIVVSEQGFP